MSKISLQGAYGTPDSTKLLKDGVLINKNSGTFGTPAYAAGATKFMTILEYAITYGQLIGVKKSLTAAQIKTGNSSPIVIADYVALALAAGHVLEPVSGFAKLTYGTVAFDGALGDLQINCAAGGALLSTGDGFVKGTATKLVKLNFPLLVALPEVSAGGNLFIQTSEDSTVGDSTIDVYLSYRIVKL